MHFLFFGVTVLMQSDAVMLSGDLPKDFASSFVAPPMSQSSRDGAGRCRAIPKRLSCSEEPQTRIGSGSVEGALAPCTPAAS